MLMTKEEINNLILDNQKLAYKIVQKYKNKVKSFMEYDDLKAIALYGLVKAANTFDSSRNIQFSTYAFKVIENQILIQIRKDAKLININNLDDMIQNTDNIKYIDLIDSNIDLENELIQSLELEHLVQFIDELPDNLKTIMQLTLKGFTQVDISKKLKVCQPQVSKLYHKAIRILRFKFINKGGIKNGKYEPYCKI